MAVFSVCQLSALRDPLVLCPERYDPRRSLPVRAGDRRISELAKLRRVVVQPRKAPRSCLVVDTTHARSGILAVDRPPVPGSQLGSTKKVARAGDVIISRLRPYLRQVALIDDEIPLLDVDTALTCSTEFYVLEPRDERSIAFLVAVLLSAPVQRVLAAAQEGGHHPRFDAETLLSLPIREPVLAERDALSLRVEEAARAYRRCEGGLALAVDHVDLGFAGG